MLDHPLLRPGRHDWRFRFAGFPTRVHPLFWLVAALIGPPPTRADQLLIWVVVVFVSILIHETGHALVYRRYGWDAEIALLPGFGLAIGTPNPFSRPLTPRQSAALALAGPGAQLLIVAVVVAVDLSLAASSGAPSVLAMLLGGSDSWLLQLVGPGRAAARIATLFGALYLVNVVYSVLNLVPLMPLDGWQVSRALLASRGEHGALVASLKIGIGAGAALVVVAAALHEWPAAAVFFVLALVSLQTLQRAGAGYGGYRGGGGYDDGYGRGW